MSITLMAYPMAFLIAPEKAPKEHLREKKDSNKTPDIKNAKDNISNAKVTLIYFFVGKRLEQKK